MMIKRFWQGVTVAALVLCLGLVVVVAAEEVEAPEASGVDTVLSDLAAAVEASDLADDVRERVAGYVAELSALVGDDGTDEALLAAVSAALESAEGEYRAFLTGVKVALENGSFGAAFAAAAVALAAEDALAAADAEVWTQILTVEVAAE